MNCCLCKKPNVDLVTSCQHSYHSACFQKGWKEWHLPCVVCRLPLGHMCVDSKGNMLVTVDAGDKLCCCYQVTANNNKIEKRYDSISKWVRQNGRLCTRTIWPVHFNICVS